MTPIHPRHLLLSAALLLQFLPASAQGVFPGADENIPSQAHYFTWINNTTTAPHNRAGALWRGLPPELKRQAEDHGVCLSSCLDFWQDDLVLFGMKGGGQDLNPSVWLTARDLPFTAKRLKIPR